jgi:hypothetical protein
MRPKFARDDYNLGISCQKSIHFMTFPQRSIKSSQYAALCASHGIAIAHMAITMPGPQA